MRARYAISNIAAIGRPGRCGPVSYTYDTIVFISLEASATKFAWPIAYIGPVGPYVTAEGSVRLGAISMPFNWEKLDGRPISRTSAHELGHTLGLQDLYRAPANRRVRGWDLMDLETDLPHFSIAHRMMLGWIPATSIKTFDFSDRPTVDETVRLTPAELQPNATSPVAAEIRIADGYNYYFEYRTEQDTQIGDRRLPKNNAVLGTDVVSYSHLGELPLARPPIELLVDDGDGDNSAFGSGQDYRESDLSDAAFPTEFRADITTLTDQSGADVRIRNDATARPDPSIRPSPASPDRKYQSPDIEVHNERNRVAPEWANVPWAANPNTVVAKVTNRGGMDARAVRVNFYVSDYTIGGAPKHYLGSDTRDIPAKTTVEFSTTWTPPREGHFCVHVIIPLYEVPGIHLPEVTEYNNHASSNYTRFISTSASPATREWVTVAVKNPYDHPATVHVVPGQSNPLYRSYVDHTWVRLGGNGSAKIRVASEYAGDQMSAEEQRRLADFRYLPNRVSVEAIIHEDEPLGDTIGPQGDIALVPLGGVDMEIVERQRTSFSNLKLTDIRPDGGTLFGGQVKVVRDDSDAPDGTVIVTLTRSEDGRQKVWNMATPFRRGSFKLNIPDKDAWDTVRAYYVAPPRRVADAESKSLDRGAVGPR
ncbi:MAG: hypothetical protein IPK13_27285 [Deltaproteobacteria bacterium]|nr:hypothetical protein [Deltaproteobacteria bacterium]